MKYESEQDVALRLRHSVVMYEHRPVLVSEVISKDTVQVTDIISGEEDNVRVTHLDLQPSSAKLGYVVAGNGTVFVAMRKPCRRYKQGLTQENLVSRLALNEPRIDPRGVPRAARGLAFNCRQIGETILGHFDDIGDAFAKVRAGVEKIVPFHRDWAIADHEDELSLVYRGEVVGYVGNSSVKLLPERFYLKECLELCLK